MKLTEEQMQYAWTKFERGHGLTKKEVKAMLKQIGPALSYLRQRSALFGSLVKTETVLTAERLMSIDVELAKSKARKKK